MTARKLLYLFLLLALIPFKPSLCDEDPFQTVIDAIVRHDFEDANLRLQSILPSQGQSLENKESFRQAALLEAASAPLYARTSSLLSIAQCYPDEDQGLTALVACLHCLEMQLGLRDLKSKYDRSQRDQIIEIYLSCLSLFRSWRNKEQSDIRVNIADKLLAACALNTIVLNSEVIGDTIYINTTDYIPIPSPLAEKVEVSIFKLCGPDKVNLIYNREEGRLRKVLKPCFKNITKDDPFYEDVFSPRENDLWIPAPGPGTYLLKVRSIKNEYARIRVIVVSNLDAVAHSCADGFAIVAAINNVPSQGVKISNAETGELFCETDDTGLALAAFPEEMQKKDLLCLCVKGEHRKLISVNRRKHYKDQPPEANAHIFMDRSIYRPGETIQGRIVVRRHDGAAPFSGPLQKETDSSPVSSPLENREVIIEIAGIKTLTVKTDSFGVSSFKIPLKLSDPLGPVNITAWLPVKNDDEFKYAYKNKKHGVCVKLCHLSSAADIQEFRRPPLLWDVAWPKNPLPKDKAPELLISARFPTGAPAIGLKGSITAQLGDVEHTVPFYLDSKGEARAIVAINELRLPAGKVHIFCAAEIKAADGQVLSKEHHLTFKDKPAPSSDLNIPAARKNARKSTDFKFEIPNKSCPAGEPVNVTLNGPSFTPVLLTVGRACILHTKVVILGESGFAELSIPTKASWEPGVYMRASRIGNAQSSYKYLKLKPADQSLFVELEGVDPKYEPGADVKWTVRTRDRNGGPTPSTVAITVIDERIARFFNYDLLKPDQDLYPHWYISSPYIQHSEFARLPEDIFKYLITEGRLASPFDAAFMAKPAPGLGGPSGPTTKGFSKSANPRTKFRSTAFFAGDIYTGPDGSSEIAFKMPDDLTEWRIIMIAVDRGRETAVLEEKTRTVRDPSITPILPRFMRKGDTLKVKALAQSAEHLLPEGGRVTFKADKAIRLDPINPEISLTVDHSKNRQTETVQLSSHMKGEGLFSAALKNSEGTILDQVDLTLPCSTDRVIRSLWSAESITQKGICIPPSVESKTPLKITLEIIGNLSILIKKGEAFLDEYPYGCAEQVSSCLYPMILSLHPDFGSTKNLSPLKARRLEEGMAKLSKYQNSDGGFSWWGSGATDPMMSASVFNFLALMKEVGIDPESYGITLNPDCRLFKQAQLKPERKLEAAVSRLLLFPDNTNALKDCIAAADNASDLPFGLCARCGRALFLAGKEKAAMKILDNLKARITEIRSSGAASMNESPVCRVSAFLELILLLAPENPARAQAVIDLVMNFDGHRFGHTFGTAVALTALRRNFAISPEKMGDEQFIVKAVGDQFSKKLMLDKQNGWRAECQCPVNCGPISIENSSGRPVLAVTRVDFEEYAKEAQAIASPLVISRQLYRLLPDRSGALTKREKADKVHVDDILEAEISVSKGENIPYLVIDCPLPAGFEVIRSSKNEEIHDNRVVRLFTGNEKSFWRLRITPTAEGSVLWPPVVAEDMYDSKIQGRSTGSMLKVEPRIERSAGSNSVRVLTKDRFENLLEQQLDFISKSKKQYEITTVLNDIDSSPIPVSKTIIYKTIPTILERWKDNYAVARAYSSLAGGIPDDIHSPFLSMVRFFDDYYYSYMDPSAFLTRLRTDYSFVSNNLKGQIACELIGDLDIEEISVAEEKLLLLSDTIFAALPLMNGCLIKTKEKLLERLHDLLTEAEDLNKHSLKPLRILLRRRAQSLLMDLLICSKKYENEQACDLEELFLISTKGLKKKQIRDFTYEIVMRLIELAEHEDKRRLIYSQSAYLLSILPDELFEQKNMKFLDSLILPLFYFSFKLESDPTEKLKLDLDCEELWDLLSQDRKRSVPSSIVLQLLIDNQDAEYLDELLMRDDFAFRRLLNSMHLIRDEEIKSIVLKSTSVKKLFTEPLSSLLKLTPPSYVWFDEDSKKPWGRLLKAIINGPWTDEELAKTVAVSKDPDIRFLMVQALCSRKYSDVKFSSNDMAAPFYRDILLASLNVAGSAKTVRDTLLDFDMDHSEEEINAMLWAVKDTITFDEVLAINIEYRYNVNYSSIPDTIARHLVGKMPGGRILQILQDDTIKNRHLYFMMENLNDDTLVEIGDEIIALAQEDKIVRWSHSIYDTLIDNEHLTKQILRIGTQISSSFAIKILNHLKLRKKRFLAVVFSGSLLNHNDIKVRSVATQLLFRCLGDINTWVLPDNFEEDKIRKAVISLHRALYHEGIVAVERALSSKDQIEKEVAKVLVARLGIYSVSK